MTAVETPVALIVFNRPDCTRRVFEAIRAARPRTLLVVADGPRPDHPGDGPRCEEVREIARGVDWDCDVRTEFAAANLGCGRRPATGLDWVFGQVPEAIILEDDCVPASDFFPFCEAMLARYRDDPRVMHVCGSNFSDTSSPAPSGYHFSAYPVAWGWATWRRAWAHFDPGIPTWPEVKRAGGLRSVCPRPGEEAYWTGVFDQLHAGKLPCTWDYAWTYACWAQRGLAVVPGANLVSNIGDGADATHTVGVDGITRRPVRALPGPYQNPPSMLPDADADQYVFDHVYPGRYLRPASLPRRLARAARDVGRRLLAGGSG